MHPNSRIFGTFGIYRYLLAVTVMAGHTAYASLAFASDFAVFAFFVLSGYVVSYILHYTYLPRPRGWQDYALNRALRIYPPFWVASLLLLALILHYHPERMPSLQTVMGYPSALSAGGLASWIVLNLSALGSVLLLGGILRPSIMPTGWSLGVEIVYWAVIPLMLTRRGWLKGVAVFALSYTVFTASLAFLLDQDLVQLRYFSLFAGALPFTLGLLLFLLKRDGRLQVNWGPGIGAIASLLLLLCAWPALRNGPLRSLPFSGMYLSLALNTVIIAYLSGFDQRRISAGLRKLDSFLGDLTYPIYLMHMPVWLVARMHWPELHQFHIHLFFLLIFAGTNLAGWLLHASVELPLAWLRGRIRREPS